MRRVALAWALVAAVWAWTAALVLAPLAAAGRGAGRAVVAASLLVYVAGGTVCHQHPARTVHLWGVPMPVCARCTGLYLGAPAGLALALWRARRPHGPMSDRSARRLLLWPTLPTLASVGSEVLGLGATPAWARLLLAVPLAAAAAWVCGERLSADVARER